MSSSTIDKKLEIFESICELKMTTMNFESIFEKNANFEPISESSVIFEFFQWLLDEF